MNAKMRGEMLREFRGEISAWRRETRSSGVGNGWPAWLIAAPVAAIAFAVLAVSVGA